MKERSEFDHRPDPQIRRALRTVLSGSDHAAFVKHVVARAADSSTNAPAGDWWEVLSGWVRPGLAASVALTAAATIWLAGSLREPESGTAIADALLTTGEGVVPAAFLMTTEPPDADAVLELVLENR